MTRIFCVGAAGSAAGPIKLFQSAQSYYQAIGIFPSQLQPTGHVNWKNFVIISACILCFISISTYFLFEANSLTELAITFYGCTGLVSGISYYLTNIYQRENIFKLIGKFEDFIEKRKFSSFHLYSTIQKPKFVFLPKGSNASVISRCAYIAMNAKIEKMSKILHFLLIQVNIPAALVPTLIFVAASYYFYGLGDESFRLMMPLT